MSIESTTSIPIGPITEATVLVPDLDGALRRYVEGFGWTAHSEVGPWGQPRAARWGAPTLGHALAVRVGPEQPAGATGNVCLVQDRDVVPPPPLKSFGWTALEVVVRDVEAAVERAMKAGWKLLREPARLGAGGRLPLVAGQLAAPSGEAVYVTQILGEVHGFDLPTARQDVDGVFIAVLGVPDLVATRSILERRFAVRRGSDRRSPIGVVNSVFGLPADTTHRLSTLQLSGQTCLEIDELPSSAVLRPRSPGSLPGGVAGVTVAAEALEGQVLELPGGALLELIVRPGAGQTGSGEITS